MAKYKVSFTIQGSMLGEDMPLNKESIKERLENFNFSIYAINTYVIKALKITKMKPHISRRKKNI